MGTFIFALANGTLEAVANPLVATLFPNNRTHYLNILHASWPAGLVLGGLVGWMLGDGMHVGWKMQLGLFLMPTCSTASMFFGQQFPKSEASAKGLSSVRCPDVGFLGALVACFLIGLFFKEHSAAFSGSSPDNRSSPQRRGASFVAVALGLLLVVGVNTNFSVGSCCCSCSSSRTRWSARSSSAPTAGFRTSPATS